jgi:alpha-ketoglutarate-dependent taurine dioxygenase
MKPLAFRPELYKVSTPSELIRACGRVDAPVIMNRPLEAADLLKLGFIIGRDVQDSEAFGQVREIANAEGTRSIAKSLAAHPMHTDGTFMDKPPDYFLLYFIRSDPGGGGISEFLAVSDLLGEIEAEHFRALVEHKVRFARRDDDGRVDSWEGSLLGHDSQGRLAFRWRHDDEVRPEAVDRAAAGELGRALRRVRALIARLPRLTYAALEGDLVCVPNRTWLHGRTKLSPESDRRVLRVWVA